MKMQIKTIFKHGTYYGIGGALGNHIIGAYDNANGKQIFVAQEGSDEKTCLCTGNHEPLATTAKNRPHLKKRMEALANSPRIFITLPGHFDSIVMVFPHFLPKS